MSAGPRPSVANLLPDETWSQLSETPDAVLVDVRTKPEWSFVGIPDLSPLGRSVLLSEWRQYPDMSVNPEFASALIDGLGDKLPSRIFFICRSGARSMEAATAVSAELGKRGLSAECINVAEGFEGDLDAENHRGTANGWQARGLPWRQS
ncbi:sulfurtransferase [Maritimibacter sp. 55A14]|uniref:rhodanese-like domain-containing protein n=1 Tax=Maritimibacter sp. 55A14 TaxID=2174844 RepID=UPI000D61DB8F|nr:rhodanese-like domain-containing protein [Maritimibacter sp. 55A14]PWE32521.1 sulfurtransferase [Maritimibacter sp. 55A14]